MQLTAGDALGPYAILGPAGSGGMGEVYKARDTRLNRVVALKIIAVGQADAPDSRTRFADEARAIAALNHPHICALYDTGHALDRDFLVLEYLEGETLAQRLRRGPLRPREVLGIAIEISEALDYAHRHNIVHRDLKPANVFLTRDSGAKLLDFGLADLRATARSAGGLSTCTTQPLGAAPDGMISGTLQYLAPEIFDGRPARPSSDIFAFGAVFYEMITNRSAFDDASPARVMAAILSKEPSPVDAASGAPAEFQWIVQHCLAKDPDARWQSMGDVAKILKGIARTSDVPASTADVRRPWTWLAASAALTFGIVAAAMAFRPSPPSSESGLVEPLTLSLLPPAGSVFGLTDSTLKSAQFAVAPDGRSVVFVAVTGGVRALWLQDMRRTEARLLPGTSGASYPFWSPDSQFVGFFADGFLKKVSLAGRSPLPVCRALNGRGGAWSPDDRIVFAPDAASPLSIVNAAGGDPRPFTELGANRLGHRWPQVLRDGRVLLFVKNDKPELQGIYVTSLARPGELRQIRATSAAGLVVAGHLLFVLGGELVAQPLDPDKAALSGEPVPVGLKVSTSSAMSSPVSASESGVLATWSRGGLSQLVWFDRSGIRLGTAGPPDRYFDFRLSPDERRVALSRIDPASDTPDLGMLDLNRNFVTAVSSSSQTDASPIWSATGDRLVFRSNRRGLHELFEKPALDNGGERLLHAAGVGIYPTDWSPDGRTILFHVLDATTKHDIWTFDLASRTAKPLLDGRAEEAQGQLAPGGRLAYTSDESGQLQVYVRLVGSETLPNRVSTKGGFDPRWRADGRELFFVSPDGMMTAADVSPEGQPISSRELFRTAIEPTSAPYLSDFVVSKDGRKFLIKVPTEPPGAGPITVTLNWLERLRGHGR